MNNFTKQRILAESKFHRLMAEGYLPLNFWTVRILGTEAAVMLAALYDEFNYRKYSGQLEGMDTFKFSVARAKEMTGLSATKQNKAIKVLEEYGIICKVIKSKVQKIRYFQFKFAYATKFMYDIEQLIRKDEKEKEDRVKKHKEIQDKIAAWHESHPKTEAMGYANHEEIGIKQVPHTPEDLPF